MLCLQSLRLKIIISSDFLSELLKKIEENKRANCLKLACFVMFTVRISDNLNNYKCFGISILHISAPFKGNNN
jgi:hypothetical protein